MQHESNGHAILAADSNLQVEERHVSFEASSRGDPFSGASGDGKVVLLVEDEPALREILSEYLQDFGYRVREAEDGVAALRIIQDDPAHIDMLVSDIGLPGGVDGTQVARAMQTHRPSVPIILITGYSRDPFVAGTDLIRKPFDPLELAERVNTRLSPRVS